MIQIFGKGGFAREVLRYCKMEWPFFNPKCYENEEIKDTQKNYPTIIAIGDVQIRKKLAQENPDHKYTNLIQCTSYDDNVIGVGNILCPGTIITTGVVIGDHVIINLNCTIGHDCRIGNFVTFSPGANVSGNVEIGDECYIGTNAVIREKIKICSGVTIGAGAVVVKDITEPGVYVGNPAKKVEKKEKTITREATNEEIIYALNDSNTFKFTSGALNVLKAVLNRHGISFTKTTNQ